jgi:hypothetical protein
LKDSQTLGKLLIRNERKRGIGAEASALSELPETAAGSLLDPSSGFEHKFFAFEYHSGFLGSRETLTDQARPWEEAKQRWKPVELIPKSPSDKNTATRSDDPAELARARATIADMVKHLR